MQHRRHHTLARLSRLARPFVVAVIAVSLGSLACAGCVRRGARYGSAGAPSVVRAGPIEVTSILPMSAGVPSQVTDEIDGSIVRTMVLEARAPKLAISVAVAEHATGWSGSRSHRLQLFIDALVSELPEGMSLSPVQVDQRDGVISIERSASVMTPEGSVMIRARGVLSARQIGTVIAVGDPQMLEQTFASIRVIAPPADRFYVPGSGELASTTAWRVAWPLGFACSMPEGLRSTIDPQRSSWTVGDAQRTFEALQVPSRSVVDLRDEVARHGSSVSDRTSYLRGHRAHRMSERSADGWSEWLVWEGHSFRASGPGQPTEAVLAEAERFLGSCVPL